MCWSTCVQSVHWCRASLQFSSLRVSIAVLKKKKNLRGGGTIYCEPVACERKRERKKKKKVSNPNCANGHCFETSRQMMTCFWMLFLRPPCSGFPWVPCWFLLAVAITTLFAQDLKDAEAFLFNTSKRGLLPSLPTRPLAVILGISLLLIKAHRHNSQLFAMCAPQWTHKWYSAVVSGWKAYWRMCPKRKTYQQNVKLTSHLQKRTEHWMLPLVHFHLTASTEIDSKASSAVLVSKSLLNLGI